jgi:1,2-diacylglycerol 3-alpha-glucosyltransferase
MCSGLGHVARGIETWADSVATELDRRGLEITLFKGAGTAARPFERVVRCLHRTRPLAQHLVRWAPKCAWRLGLHQQYDIEQTTFALSILPHLIRQRYDLIHLQDPWLAYILEKTRRLHGASVILGHGTEEAPWLLRKFQHVQELTPFYLSRHGDIGDRQWFAVPNFVDTTRFQPGDKLAARRELGLPENAFIVLSAAALNRSKKRLDWLVNEFATANRPNAFLVLAGQRELETPSLVEEAQALLGNRVRVLESVPHQRMPLLYQAADLHVICSLMEVMGISIVEAMAAGVMNVVHQWGSVKWVVGDTGVATNMERPGALSDVLRSLDLDSCQKQGLQARRRAIDTFSVEAVVDQMLGMYDAVLANRPGKRRSLVPAT